MNSQSGIIWVTIIFVYVVTVSSSYPQRSVLGPLLFVSCVYDLPEGVSSQTPIRLLTTRRSISKGIVNTDDCNFCRTLIGVKRSSFLQLWQLWGYGHQKEKLLHSYSESSSSAQCEVRPVVGGSRRSWRMVRQGLPFRHISSYVCKANANQLVGLIKRIVYFPRLCKSL